jgi:hypothetical protein
LAIYIYVELGELANVCLKCVQTLSNVEDLMAAFDERQIGERVRVSFDVSVLISSPSYTAMQSRDLRSYLVFHPEYFHLEKRKS